MSPPLTGVGTILSVVVPSPSAPLWFTPQQYADLLRVTAAPVLVKHIASLNLPDLTIVSPDAGGVERARAYSKRLNASLAIVDKRRTQANVSEVMNLIGHPTLSARWIGQ